MDEGTQRIRRFYIFRMVTSFALWMPFWTLWVYKNLDDVFLMTVVDTAFWITMILFQIPAGLLGDRYGRRTMLLIGELMYAVGLLAFGLSTGFPQFLASNVIWALGVCFIVSGDTPFVYDTLLELKRGKDFTKVMGTANALMLMTNAVACVVGGYLVQTTDHPEYTLIIASVIGFTGSFAALALKEPKIEHQEMETYRKHLRKGLKVVTSSRPILTLILFQIILEIGIYVMAVFRSVYMQEELKLNYLEIGLFYAAFMVVGGMIVRRASNVEASLGEKGSLWMMYLALAVSFAVVFIVQSPAAIMMQFLIYSVSVLQGPIIGDYINRRVDSAHRSTVMGIATFIFTFILTIVEVSAGYIGELWGLRESLLVLAIGSAPIAIYLLVLWGRELDKEKAESSKAKKQRTLKIF